MTQQPTISQYEGTAKFHRKMEKIFARMGKLDEAKKAKIAAQKLENKIAELKK